MADETSTTTLLSEASEIPTMSPTARRNDVVSADIAQLLNRNLK
jgi:hypothetical protein